MQAESNSIDWSSESVERHFESLYEAAKVRARHALRQEFRPTRLQTTELVHEAYLRIGRHKIEWQSGQHFLNVISSTVRRVLVDQARARRALKRVDPTQHDGLGDAEDADFPVEDVVAIHDALEHYAIHDPQKAKLVELRIFGGLTLEESAATLSVSKATAKRYWTVAKLQLAKLL